MNFLQSVWGYRCPRCRSTKMFKVPFKPTDPLSMHEKCEVCGQDFEPEPGFYYGAMFLSYIVGVFYIIFPALFLKFILGWSTEATMTFTILIGIVTYFRLMRIARSLWIHIVVKYDPQSAVKAKS